jgi:phosphatidate phosphatase LPIN
VWWATQDNATETTLRKSYAKTLRLTSDQRKSRNPSPGINTISFSVTSSYSGISTCSARIFLWDSDFQVVISDIDGTITKFLPLCSCLLDDP